MDYSPMFHRIGDIVYCIDWVHIAPNKQHGTAILSNTRHGVTSIEFDPSASEWLWAVRK